MYMRVHLLHIYTLLPTHSLTYSCNLFLIADGSCYLFSTEDVSNGLVKCTGSNLDAVNCVKALNNVIYTICKDGIVRMYDLQHTV